MFPFIDPSVLLLGTVIGSWAVLLGMCGVLVGLIFCREDHVETKPVSDGLRPFNLPPSLDDEWRNDE